MIEIVIKFGDPELSNVSEPETFKFATKPEADAFMTGVVSAEGWLGYEVLHDTRSGQDTGSER